MTVRDPCPCGCGGEVPPVTGLGTTPFISVKGVKVYLATHECSKRCTCGMCGPKEVGCSAVLTESPFGRLYFCDVTCLQTWQQQHAVGA